MNRPYLQSALACLVLAVAALPAPAATYCVGTAAELRNALTAAAASGADDEILVRTGTYETGGTPFIYNSTNSGWFGLFGGYEAFNGNPCGRRVQEAGATVLTANRNNRVLLVAHNAPINAAATRYILDNLTLDGGVAPAGFNSGALDMFTGVESSNEFWLDNLIVRNSTASFGGGAGLYMRRGLIKLSNSLFHANSATNAGAHINLTVLQGVASPNVILSGNTFANGTCPGQDLRGCGIIMGLGGTVQAQVINSVFHANQINDITAEGLAAGGFGNGTLRYDDSLVPVSGGNLTPTINRPLSGDPGFVNAAGGDFRPTDASILVNRGYTATPFYPPNVFDLRAGRRVVGFARDVGAYEHQDRVFRDSLEAVASP
jgi:hypothetical protein